MNSSVILPDLSDLDRAEGIRIARKSSRRRHAKIMHETGAYSNRVYNFLAIETYMQPHLHPGEDKIEEIYIIEGRIAVVFFNDLGDVVSMCELGSGVKKMVRVPAYTWHTYVVLSEIAITYETMDGIYNPGTWKKFALWAPSEDEAEGKKFLDGLRLAAATKFG